MNLPYVHAVLHSDLKGPSFAPKINTTYHYEVGCDGDDGVCEPD